MIGLNLRSNSLFVILFFIICECFSQAPTQPITNTYTPIDNNCEPCEEDIPSANAYAGSIGVGDYSLWYGCGELEVNKPFIYLEGIDLTPGGNFTTSNDPLWESLYEELIEDGFDVIQLNFKQNPQYIQRNAELLITLINNLNAELQANGSNHEIVIMGESMGAIIARYALTKMENDGEDHNVRFYVSLDGPHQGANVPWGLQYLSQDLSTSPVAAATVGSIMGSANIVTFFIDAFADLLAGGGGIGGFEAAFQLLRDSPIPLANVYGFAFRNNLNNKGNYPTQCRNVAMSNGRSDGVGLLGVNEGSNILRLTIPKISGFDVHNAFAAPGISILGAAPNVVYSKIPSSGINLKSRYYLPGKTKWDVSPGGTFFDDFDYGIYKQHRFTFIPLVSSLDLNTNDPYYSLINNVNGFSTTVVPEGATGTKIMFNTAYTHSNGFSNFDAIWADQDNSSHVAGEGLSFLLQEISPSTLVVQGIVINDNAVFEAENVVKVGSDLSAQYPTGDVEFQNGAEVDIWAGDEVYLQDGMHAQLGSEVHFYIDSYDCQ